MAATVAAVAPPDPTHEGVVVTLANRITISRLLMIPFFVVAIIYYEGQPWLRHTALGIYIAAAITDALDGFIARAYNQKTKLGAVLDPLADKLLINIAYILMSVNEYIEPSIPKWLPVIILSRDIFITGGAYVINTYYGPVRIRPRLTGKLTAVLQSASIVAVLVSWRFAWELLMVMLALSLISWVDYFYKGYEQIGDEDGQS